MKNQIKKIPLFLILIVLVALPSPASAMFEGREEKKGEEESLSESTARNSEKAEEAAAKKQATGILRTTSEETTLEEDTLETALPEEKSASTTSLDEAQPSLEGVDFSAEGLREQIAFANRATEYFLQKENEIKNGSFPSSEKELLAAQAQEDLALFSAEYEECRAFLKKFSDTNTRFYQQRPVTRTSQQASSEDVVQTLFLSSAKAITTTQEFLSYLEKPSFSRVLVVSERSLAERSLKASQESDHRSLFQGDVFFPKTPHTFVASQKRFAGSSWRSAFQGAALTLGSTFLNQYFNQDVTYPDRPTFQKKHFVIQAPSFKLASQPTIVLRPERTHFEERMHDIVKQALAKPPEVRNAFSWNHWLTQLPGISHFVAFCEDEEEICRQDIEQLKAESLAVKRLNNLEMKAAELAKENQPNKEKWLNDRIKSAEEILKEWRNLSINKEAEDKQAERANEAWRNLLSSKEVEAKQAWWANAVLFYKANLKTALALKALEALGPESESKVLTQATEAAKEAHEAWKKAAEDCKETYNKLLNSVQPGWKADYATAEEQALLWFATYQMLQFSENNNTHTTNNLEQIRRIKRGWLQKEQQFKIQKLHASEDDKTMFDTAIRFAASHAISLLSEEKEETKKTASSLDLQINDAYDGQSDSAVLIGEKAERWKTAHDIMEEKAKTATSKLEEKRSLLSQAVFFNRMYEFNKKLEDLEREYYLKVRTGDRNLADQRSNYINAQHNTELTALRKAIFELTSKYRQLEAEIEYLPHEISLDSDQELAVQSFLDFVRPRIAERYEPQGEKNDSYLLEAIEMTSLVAAGSAGTLLAGAFKTLPKFSDSSSFYEFGKACLQHMSQPAFQRPVGYSSVMAFIAFSGYKYLEPYEDRKKLEHMLLFLKQFMPK